MIDKYKISPVAIDAAKKKDKKSLKNDHDEKEGRLKQTSKDYPIVEIDNQVYTEGKLKQMIDTLSDSDLRKKHYKKILEEMKDIAEKKADKELNKRKDTAYTEVDEILEMHPIYKYDETKDIMTLDYLKMKASKLTEDVNKEGVVDELTSAIMQIVNEKLDDFNPELPEDIEFVKEILNETIKIIKEAFYIEGELKADNSILEPTLEPSIEPSVLPQEDVFDIGDGLPLGDGYMAHKDPEDGKIYVLDKVGNQIIKVQNAFVNDMALVIEFFRDFMGLGEEIIAPNAPQPDVVPPLESAETDDSEKDKDKDIGVTIEEEENDEEEDEEVYELDKEPSEDEEEINTQELGQKLDELIQVNKETGDEIKKVVEKEEEEDLPDNTEKKMLELKDQIERKKEKVSSTIKFMIKNNKLNVSQEDINEKRIAGESVIFAKQRAEEDRIKKMTNILLSTSDGMIEEYMKEMKNNNEQKADNIFKNIFKNG